MQNLRVPNVFGTETTGYNIQFKPDIYIHRQFFADLMSF